MNCRKKVQLIVVVSLLTMCGSMAAAETVSGAVWPSSCDVNSDHAVNAMDVQLVINGALGIAVPMTTDINLDGGTDAGDVQTVINMALSGKAPRLTVSELPPYGSPDGMIEGTALTNQNIDNWRVALFGRVPNSDQYFLLSPTATLSLIGPDGNWTAAANADPSRDSKDLEFLAFFVAASSIATVPAASTGEPTIAGAVDMVRAERKPDLDVGTPSIADGVHGKTNCDYRGFGVLCYVQYGPENSNRVYPQPLSDPAGSNYLAPINSDGTFHVALDQTSLGSVVTDYDPSKAITVLTQVMPFGADYVDAWPEFVDNLGLNFYDQVAQAIAPIAH